MNNKKKDLLKILDKNPDELANLEITHEHVANITKENIKNVELIVRTANNTKISQEFAQLRNELIKKLTNVEKQVDPEIEGKKSSPINPNISSADIQKEELIRAELPTGNETIKELRFHRDLPTIGSYKDISKKCNYLEAETTRKLIKGLMFNFVADISQGMYNNRSTDLPEDTEKHAPNKLIIREFRGITQALSNAQDQICNLILPLVTKETAKQFIGSINETIEGKYKYWHGNDPKIGEFLAVIKNISDAHKTQTYSENIEEPHNPNLQEEKGAN